MHLIRKLVAVLALAGACSTASAVSSLVIEPAAKDVGPVGTPAGTFSLQVLGQGFTDIVFAGGFNLSFDADILSLDSVAFNAALWDLVPEPGDLPIDAANVSGTLSDVWFNATVASPTNNFSVATLHFTAKAPGTSPVTLSASEAFPFVNMAGQEIGVNWDEASSTVTVTTAVPLPPTAWMFASGLAMLGLVRLRRRVGSALSGVKGTFA